MNNPVCPICGSENHEIIGTKEDRKTIQDTYTKFDVLRCLGDCKCLYIEYPEGWDIHSIYEESDTYHVQRQVETHHDMYEDRFKHDFCVSEKRLDKASEYTSFDNKTLLDVGCSNGALVLCALMRSLDAYGSDISPYIIERCKNNHLGKEYRFVTHNLDGHVFDFENIPETFDIVQCNDVVEHSANPLEFLRKLKNLLRDKNSLMFVDTPNFASELFVQKGIDYHHLKPVEHHVMLTPDSLRYMCTQVEIDVVDIYFPIPGKMVLVGKK